MGCFDTTSTSESGKGPMSPEQKALLESITNAVLPSYMEQAGYSGTPTTYNTWTETPEYKSMTSQMEGLRDERDAIAKRISDSQHAGAAPISDTEMSRLRDRLDSIDSSMNQVNAKLRDDEASFTPHTTFAYEKKEPTVELQQAKDQYGVDSQQYKDAKAAYGEKQVVQEKQKGEIQQQYMDNVQKFLEGDFSITPDQEKWVQGQMAPIKSAVDELFKGGMEAVSKMKDQVAQTTMKVGDALKVVGQTIEQTGKDLNTVLTSTIETNKELLKMGIEDKSGEITKRVSSAAIATGRDPSDPEYQKEIQTSVAREIKYGTLNLAQLEAQGKMSIAERTGSGREEIAKAMARLAETEGTKLEGLTGQEFQLQQNKGGADVRLAEAGSNMRQNIGMGLPPSQISVGSGFASMDSAQANQRLLNAAAPMSALGYPYNLYAGQQPTTSTSTQQGGWQDWANMGLDFAGLGADIFSASKGVPRPPSSGWA